MLIFGGTIPLTLHVTHRMETFRPKKHVRPFVFTNKIFFYIEKLKHFLHQANDWFVIYCFLSGICETMAQRNISINDSTGSHYDLFLKEWGKLIWTQNYAESVFVWVLSVVEIPVMILTLIALCFIIKSRPAASVFVSHLILSDLIQFICLLIKTVTSWTWKLYGAYYYSLIVGLYFMACVAFERYLLVSHPIWYKSHHSLKLSCFISVIIWFVPLIFANIGPPHIVFKTLPVCIACLIPYPIIILCFAGTWRGLSHSISLTALKRKLILGCLFLVLVTYTFIILPL